MSTLDELKQAVIQGDATATETLTQRALDEGQPLATITEESLISGMREVGELFEEGEYFVPDMLISSQAMQGAMELLKPLLQAGDYEPAGRIVIGTVAGDLHDIGKGLVGMMLEGNGFEVIDLGTDVTAQQFVDAVRENDAQLVGLSALLTTTMPMMEEIIKALREELGDAANSIKVMVGGAPVTAAYADEVGADGYADNASHAVNLAHELVAA